MIPFFVRAASIFLIFAVGLASAETKINLNPQYGSQVYFPPAIFTPDLDAGVSMKDQVIVVFHGFRSALPNGTFKRIREMMSETHSVIGVNYEYFDIEGTKKLLGQLRTDYLKGREVAVVGTSLGGYWANWFGHQVEADKIVLLNPVSNPAIFLRKYIALVVPSQRRDISFFVSAEDVARYREIPIERSEDPKTLLILTEDDPRIDHLETLSAWGGEPNVETLVYRSGGHTMNLKKHPAREAVRSFLATE
ncbi:MAG: YqiA/YcfP family alpha/beta fold hydrolase [Pseudomonadota bacterium]